MATKLGLDKAIFQIINLLPSNITLWTRIEECVKCAFLLKDIIMQNSNSQLVLNIRYPIEIEIRDQEGSAALDNSCHFPYYNYLDNGLYEFIINNNDTRTECKRQIINEGDSNFYQLFSIFSICFLSIILWILYNKFFNKGNYTPTKVVAKKRLKSIDAFKGLTIIMMIFINYGGSDYVFFEHKPWFGLSIADVIFPWFMLISGMTISISLKSRLAKSTSSFLVWLQILKRSLKLFILGLIFNSDKSNLSTLRIPGVLQRFGICYLIAASLRLITLTTSLKLSSISSKYIKYILHLPEIPEILGYFVLLLIYTFGTFGLKYGSCPKGYQGPGGYHLNGTFFNCTGGSANYIDHIILGPNHLYQNLKLKEIYNSTMPHDPEGILGITTSTILVGFGIITGSILTSSQTPLQRIYKWIAFSAILGLATLCLTLYDTIPICKNLWSLSFVTFTGSLGICFFTIFYLLIDTLNVWHEGRPLNSSGMNPILIYLGHSIGGRYIPFYFEIDQPSHLFLILRASFGTIIWVIIGYILVKKKIVFSL